jgi:hypothetical protein
MPIMFSPLAETLLDVNSAGSDDSSTNTDTNSDTDESSSSEDEESRDLTKVMKPKQMTVFSQRVALEEVSISYLWVLVS